MHYDLIIFISLTVFECFPNTAANYVVIFQYSLIVFFGNFLDRPIFICKQNKSAKRKQIRHTVGALCFFSLSGLLR